MYSKGNSVDFLNGKMLCWVKRELKGNNDGDGHENFA